MNATAIARVSDCPGVREFRDGTGVRTYLNVAEERFVLLREPDFAEIDSLLDGFKARLHRAVVAYMSRTDGFARADGGRAHTYMFATTRATLGRRNAPLKLCHEFVSPTVLRDVLAEDGLPVPKDGIPEYIEGLKSLPLERQRRLAERILGPDLDTLVSRFGSAGRTRLADLRTINAARAEAQDPVDFLCRVAEFALRYIAASNRVRGIRREGRRGDTDSYDVATVLLLLAWFRRHGILLFPAQHLDGRLFGVYSLSWSAAVRVADVVSLYLNDAEAELYGYLHAELEAGKSFAEARPLDKKGKGGRPRKAVRAAANEATESRTATAEASSGRKGDGSDGDPDERQAHVKGAGLSTMRSLLINVFLKSNMERIGPVLRDVLDAYCEKLLDRGSTKFQFRNLLSDAFRVIQNRYHEEVGAEPLVGTKRRIAKARSEYLFPWAKDPDARRPPLLRGYVHDLRVVYWADVMDEAIRADAETSNRQGVNNLRSHINHFLRFVWMTPDFPADILRVDASRHINDRRTPETSGCLRAYIARSDLKVLVKNQAIHTLSLMFRAYIKLKGLSIDNPIDFSADKFKVDKRRKNTPRPYIGRSHLTAVKDLNAADDFALSRSLQTHKRRVWDPDRKQWRHIWFPGLAIFFDFLLSVPLRSFSRFVDSGEGDEFLVDPIAIDDAIPNRAPWAERGRREGVLYVEWPARTEGEQGGDASIDEAEADGSEDDEPEGKNPLSPFIGLYINTNKTGTDENGGFRIPWCPDDVRDNLVRLVEWQRKFNPIQKPIPCLERGNYEALKKAGQDLTIEARTKSFPLFRDPANDDNWPVSKAVIDAYWGELLWVYQQTLGKSKKPQRRFAHLVERNGRPVKEALIDIHTLRVSGISSLIEKGVPPDIVQQVVGHHTLVMTLYYSKQRHSRINRILRKKIAESRFDPVSIEHLADAADFEDLLQWLVNNRGDEDAVGAGMYRERFGRGDGSVHVMEHGICPGGHCDTGGEFIMSASTHGPVPPFACSICRYRLTGPMFLVGLVHNANRLMFQYRRVAEEISRLNGELQTIAEKHPDEDAPELEATVEMLYRESEPLALQWFAERRYVEVATDMMSDYLAMAPGRGTLPALVTGLTQREVEVAIEERPAFVLLQDLVEGAAVLPGVRAHIGDVIRDHREFLNQVLDASDLDPFLLRLPPGPAQEEAARVLGAAIVDLLRRDDDLVAVSEGKLALGEAEPLIAELASEMAAQVRATKSIDIRALLTLPQIVEKAEGILAAPRPDGVVDGGVLGSAG